MEQDILSQEPTLFEWGNKDDKEVGKKEFSEIPIVAHILPGFGDLMNTLKLAEGLKTEFPEQEVCVYFKHQDNYQKVGQLYPSFDPEKKRQRLNGITVASVDEKGLRRATGNQIVGIYSIIDNGVGPYLENLLMDSSMNFYLQEYDIEKNTDKPGDRDVGDQTGFGGLETNILYQDSAGKKHLILTTGFSETSFGIHIDQDIKRFLPEIDDSHPNPWTEILRKERDFLGNESIGDFLDNQSETTRSAWGFVYGTPYLLGAGDDTVYSLNQLVHAYLESEGDFDKRVTIFDFNSFNPNDLRFGWKRESIRESYFKHIFISNQGYNEVSGTWSMEGKPRPNVEIVHLGTQSPDVFKEFMGASELPPVITGDASAAEVISMGKPFIYNALPHKIDVIPDLLAYARRMLDSDAAVKVGSVLASEYDEQEHILEYGPGLRNIFRPGHQEAFQQLFSSIYQHKDLVKNLATSIRTAVQNYQSS
jgi:hypothetical protein